MSDRNPFGSITLPPERSMSKPRAKGLTMMADFGVPLSQQEDVLGLAGAYLDFAKIATGSARLYRRSYLLDKLALYKSHAVRPFIGGQFFEFVLAHQGWQAIPGFFAEARDLGFDTIEISDNCIPLSADERERATREAIGHGLSVMGEVGSKNDGNDVGDLILQARHFFDAGAEYVLVEAAELVAGGKLQDEMLAALREGLNFDRVMIELPGPWISGVSHHLIQDMKKALIAEFGPDVNIANVHAEDLFATEAMRVGLGVVGPTQRFVPD